MKLQDLCGYYEKTSQSMKSMLVSVHMHLLFIIL